MWQPPQRFVVTFWQCPQFVGTTGRSFAPTTHFVSNSTAARDAISTLCNERQQRDRRRVFFRFVRCSSLMRFDLFYSREKRVVYRASSATATFKMNGVIGITNRNLFLCFFSVCDHFLWRTLNCTLTFKPVSFLELINTCTNLSILYHGGIFLLFFYFSLIIFFVFF